MSDTPISEDSTSAWAASVILLLVAVVTVLSGVMRPASPTVEINRMPVEWLPPAAPAESEAAPQSAQP